jgi:hypothetical protein
MMVNWRDHILNELNSADNYLIIAVDPDGLLFEEEIQEEILKLGYVTILFEEPIEFRFIYESKFRIHRDRGKISKFIIEFKSEEQDLQQLPYDILQIGRNVIFKLNELFPNLNYRVLKELDRTFYDDLYKVVQRYQPELLGESLTKEFILRHVFKISPDSIKNSSDLLLYLLRRHYQGLIIPPIIDRYFIQILKKNPEFYQWPLETLIEDRDVFFQFLQERWPIFLDRFLAENQVSIKENHKEYGLEIEGPVHLPLEDYDIRVYIDTLFLEGYLHSVPYQKIDLPNRKWVNIGIQIDEKLIQQDRIKKLIEKVQLNLPSENARYNDWFHFARLWAELNFHIYDMKTHFIDNEIISPFYSLQNLIDNRFLLWLKKRYASLVNIPPNPPVMGHHLPRFLLRQIENERKTKIVLIILDGLSFDQWLIIKEELSQADFKLNFIENCIFGWIPTITSISRQAIFSGKPPLFFPKSLYNTGKEPILWKNFWIDQGFNGDEVAYLKNLDTNVINLSEEIGLSPKIKILGLIFDIVDKIMHGMELGTSGMYNQIRQLVQQPSFFRMINQFLENDFRVFLTSDHGNIEAQGCGKPSEGAIADIRGERVRFYSNLLLRNQVKENFPGSLEWSPVGIPEYCFPLIAPHRKAFIKEGVKTVSHGGVSVEEVIVPFIEIERKKS